MAPDAFPYLLFLERVGTCPEQVPLRTREVRAGTPRAKQRRGADALRGPDGTPRAAALPRKIPRLATARSQDQTGLSQV